MTQHDTGKGNSDCHINVLGCLLCLSSPHLLWLAVQARADVFKHRIECSADDIASAQIGQGGLMEMPFKRAGVAYETAREVGASRCNYLALCCSYPNGTCLGHHRILSAAAVHGADHQGEGVLHRGRCQTCGPEQQFPVVHSSQSVTVCRNALQSANM